MLERMKYEDQVKEDMRLQEEEQRQLALQKHELIKQQARMIAINAKRFRVRIKPKRSKTTPHTNRNDVQSQTVVMHERYQDFKNLLVSLGKTTAAAELERRSGHNLS